MIKSMTGYGKTAGNWGNKKITVELRSLNSKQFDLNLRMPGLYKEKEIELRNFFSKEIERGRVDVFITTEGQTEEAEYIINKSLVTSYFNDLKALAESVGESTADLLPIVMRLPDVLKSEKPLLEEAEWKQLNQLCENSLAVFNQFRQDEGESLKKDLEYRIGLIMNYLLEVEKNDGIRIEGIKEKIYKNLNEIAEKVSIDNNRFEQELIYYIEKLDITEEKIRLRTHCDYFIKTLNTESSEGRKLGFISQEIGREINTIGSKANNAEIQRLVVNMKDELEKIKEQLNNIL